MIKILEDVVAPAAVTSIDMLTLELKPEWNEWTSYIMTGAGYIVGALGFGGRTLQDFMLNVGKASLPLTARAIRERIKAPVAQRAGTSRLAFRATGPAGIRRYPAPATEAPFEGTRLV